MKEIFVYGKRHSAFVDFFDDFLKHLLTVTIVPHDRKRENRTLVSFSKVLKRNFVVRLGIKGKKNKK